MNRRELIATLLGVPLATLPGCSRSLLPPEGELHTTNFGIGHKIRDSYRPAATKTERVGVVIVGAGIAGLSAAWRLLESGFDDFVVLELEPRVGGTSQSGKRGGFAFPWGAHYVPVPMAENLDLIELLRQMEVVTGISENGDPIVAEQFLMPRSRRAPVQEWNLACWAVSQQRCYRG